MHKHRHTHQRTVLRVCVCVCVRLAAVFLAITHLRFTLSVLSPQVPNKDRSSPQKQTCAFTLSLATSSKQKAVHNLSTFWNMAKLRQEVDGRSLCFAPLSPWDTEKWRKRKKAAHQRRRGYSVSSYCLLQQTHTPKLTDLHLHTHSHALSHYSMTHLLCMALFCFRLVLDGTQQRLESCC